MDGEEVPDPPGAAGGEEAPDATRRRRGRELVGHHRGEDGQRHELLSAPRPATHPALDVRPVGAPDLHAPALAHLHDLYQHERLELPDPLAVEVLPPSHRHGGDRPARRPDVEELAGLRNPAAALQRGVLRQRHPIGQLRREAAPGHGRNDGRHAPSDGRQRVRLVVRRRPLLLPAVRPHGRRDGPGRPPRAGSPAASAETA
mmetsp:Transcript_33669/g.96278  ORF Transcript_33669/g.96278 Transcript_33669/m.96278 type:complete len:202 (+) Transcript_33669:720-1325(+)